MAFSFAIFDFTLFPHVLRPALVIQLSSVTSLDPITALSLSLGPSIYLSRRWVLS